MMTKMREIVYFQKKLKKMNNKSSESIKLCDDSFSYKQNILKLFRNNTLNHELAKFFLSWEILQSGGNFISEAIFKNGKRADILNLELCEAWEVVHSERENSKHIKVNEYPCKILFFDSDKINDFWLKKLTKR